MAATTFAHRALYAVARRQAFLASQLPLFRYPSGKAGSLVRFCVTERMVFEGGADETIRRKLLAECDVHTLLRLPTGIFYAQGVKANSFFFDRKPASKKPWMDKLWIYDLRTNPLKYEDLQDFINCYIPSNRHERQESERLHCFAYDDLIARDNASLDIFWLKDESLEDSENLSTPDILAMASSRT